MRFIYLLSIVIILSSCTQNPVGPTTIEKEQILKDYPLLKEVLYLSSETERQPPEIPWNPNPEAIISRGSELKIVVEGSENYSEIHTNIFSNIRTRYAGDIWVMDNKLKELQKELVSRLKKHLNDMNVKVFIRLSESVNDPIHVLGEVVRPGVLQTSSLMVLKSAVLYAGGITKDALINQIFIINKKRTELYLSNFTGNNPEKENIPVYPGDIIIIPNEKNEDKVWGAVYDYMSGKIDLTQLSLIINGQS